MRWLPTLLLVALTGCSAPDGAPADPPDRTPWTVGVVDFPASGDVQALLTDVRAARHEGYDRVVFEFANDRPAVHVEYVDRPVRACGSGDVVALPGDGWLSVRFDGARAHTEAGSPTAAPNRRALGLPTLLELISTCDFEGDVTWVAGVRSPEPFRVFLLTTPTRVVVDVRHR